jgi:GT2 family glycosyltransferase
MRQPDTMQAPTPPLPVTRLEGPPPPTVTIVVLTYNRREVVRQTVASLKALKEGWPIVVVDNGSTDGTADALAADHPDVMLVRCDRNLGAAGRNAGVDVVTTPYVAFCDDDTCWQPGALAQAAHILDRHPEVAVVSARILVGPANEEDPTCTLMSRSPLPADGLPGHRLLGFMAGASVMRADAYRDCGGYSRKLFIGGEEMLLAYDLAARDWAMVYCAGVVTRHDPSLLRDAVRRRSLLVRNAIWIAWMRLPVRDALDETRRAWRQAVAEGHPLTTLADTLRGMPWALSRRRVIPAPVRAMYCRLARAEPARDGASGMEGERLA